MPLQACPECDHEVSESALACPSCGHPFAVAGAQVCPYCHKPTLAKAQGVYGKEILINLLLLLPGLIPGAIYYFDTSRHPRCSSCRRRVRNLPRQPVPSGHAVTAS